VGCHRTEYFDHWVWLRMFIRIMRRLPTNKAPVPSAISSRRSFGAQGDGASCQRATGSAVGVHGANQRVFSFFR
jgi:hypothetical protein